MTELQPVPSRSTLRDSMRFVQRFLTNPGAVGAILPSSRYMAEAMVRDLNLTEGDLVLEYGPGTGPMTKALSALDLPSLGARYLGLELDEKFHATLSSRYPHMEFHLGSVEQVAEVLAERGLPKAKAIISGLPFASLPEAVQRGVVDGTFEVLADGGEFRAFQYVHAFKMKAAVRFRGMMSERFSGFVRSSPVLRNVPPAYVLTYTKVAGR